MECKEDGCLRPARARGWCDRHYEQQRRTGEVFPPVITCQQCSQVFSLVKYRRKFCSNECKIKYYNHQRSIRPRAQRVCAKCGTPVTTVTAKPICADCRVDHRSRPYRLEYYLEYTLRQHGLTRADYDRMLAAQDGRCAICRSETPKGPGRWHIDHDHVTGRVRGLLCNNCNRGIGYFSDDPAVIEAAARYVIAARRDLAFA